MEKQTPDSKEALIRRIEDLLSQDSPDKDELYDLTQEIIGIEWPSGEVEEGRIMDLRDEDRLDLLDNLEEALRLKADHEDDDEIAELLLEEAKEIEQVRRDVQDAIKAASELPSNPISTAETRNTLTAEGDLYRRRRRSA